ncbi:MAG: PKD domain-containing protein [Candidatus Schekmanbacteria bacterium]|nr:PKD domain-containing protein [Candidatus Schekmanbacteria bacterium]
MSKRPSIQPGVFSRPVVRVLFALIPLVIMAQPARASVSDGQSHPPSDYYTMTPPSRGASYVDPAFGTSVKRLSDALATTSSLSSGSLTYVVNEYSSMSAFNSDSSRLLLQHDSYCALYDGNGNYVRDLPFSINSGSEPRWSRLNPDVLYFISGNQLRSYNVSSTVNTLVHAFTEYAQISGKGESDISADGDHFVFAGDNRYIFVYQISTDTKGAVLDTAGQGGFDQLYLSASNYVVVGWYATGTTRYHGVELYTQNMAFVRNLARALGHMDIGRDTTGADVLIWASSADPQPLCNNGVVKIRLSDGLQTCLLSLDWSLAIHVSAPDNGGFAIVDTYAPSDPDPRITWPAYTNELLQVKLDGSGTSRLAHHRSRPLNDYLYQPKPSVSPDGTKVAYSSNFGLQDTLGYPTNYSDVYLVSLSGSSGGSNAAPTASFTVSCSDLVCAFNGTGSADSDGTIQSYSWSFGDGGSGSGATTQHTFAAAGDYTVLLTVSDNASATGSASKLVAVSAGTSNVAPTAAFSVTCTNLSCTFNGTASSDTDGTIQGFSWSFGDGSSATGSAPAHTYSNAGTYNVELTVTDNDGASDNTARVIDVTSGATSGSLVRLEEDDPAVSVVGSWSFHGSSMHSAGGALLSMEAGASVSLSFVGAEIRWIAYRDEWSGRADVYLDGQMVQTVDTYATPSQAQATAYSLAVAPAATHTVEIVVRGDNNASSGGSWVWIDALEVVQSSDGGSGGGGGGTGGETSGPVVVEQSDAAVAVAGQWFASTSAALSGGDAFLAMDRGAAATITFTGTAIDWIGYRDAWSGIAKVYVDGVALDRVDLYASTTAAQATIYSVSGLPAGTHTFTVEASGRRNKKSGGAWIWVDAFKVTR